MKRVKARRAPNASYTAEFKEQALQLVIKDGQSCADAARLLGLAPQTLHNWVKAARGGSEVPASNARPVTADQMEIARLRAELARVTMERDILEKATAYFAKGSR